MGFKPVSKLDKSVDKLRSYNRVIGQQTVQGEKTARDKNRPYLSPGRLFGWQTQGILFFRRSANDDTELVDGGSGASISDRHNLARH
jgi:hypothetical protein